MTSTKPLSLALQQQDAPLLDDKITKASLETAVYVSHEEREERGSGTRSITVLWWMCYCEEEGGRGQGRRR